MQRRYARPSSGWVGTGRIRSDSSVGPVHFALHDVEGELRARELAEALQRPLAEGQGHVLDVGGCLTPETAADTSGRRRWCRRSFITAVAPLR